MNLRSEIGSALVLTLLFIMLLTTMSTAMYLYSTKQSIFADTNYTAVASAYVADAGIEHGKALLATRDKMLNQYGQNPSDNKVGRDDFPVILPMSLPFGQYATGPGGERLTDGKQGVGTYSIRIDGAFSEVLDFDLELVRDVGFPQTRLKYGDWNRRNRLLPGKTLQVQVRQGIEVVNSLKYHYLSDEIILGQESGTVKYNPFLSNIINPFIGNDILLELNRTKIKADSYDDTLSEVRDAWGNSLVLFPNDRALDHRNEESVITAPAEGISALFFSIEPDKPFATYVLSIVNRNPALQPDVKVELTYMNSNTGSNNTITVAENLDWVDGNNSAFAILDFSFDDATETKNWRRVGIGAHPLVGTGAGDDAFSIIMDVTGTLDQGGVQISVTRGIPGDISVGLRMRTEGMPWNCWFPDYPSCPGSGSYYELMELGQNEDHVSVNLTPQVMNLGYKTRIRVNELYTISSTGNVETSLETRSLMATPVSFLDYARFSKYRIRFDSGGMVGGKVYCQQRIELIGPLSTYFYDDVLTSQVIRHPEFGEFPLDGQFYEKVPLIDFPPLADVQQFFNANASNAWVIGAPYSTDHFDIFLGNYGYVKTQAGDTFWGFDFSVTPPIYQQPDPNIMLSDSYSYRAGWVPGANEPATTVLPENFNGLIIVNGNAHVWGKLHGRSLTIVARGDIYIEREILMGTDELNPSSPVSAMSTGQGMPVNLALISLRNDGFGNFDGDIYISENAPRILVVNSSLMAFAGSIVTEDNDEGPPGSGNIDQIDTDKSHKYAIPKWSNTFNCYTWDYTNNLPSDGYAFDLNDDGRLTRGLDFQPHELPRIELGGWDEKKIVNDDYVWYLKLIGSLIDQNGAAFYNYAARGRKTSPVHQNGITRNFRYNPSIRINTPPLVPMPINALKILEIDHALYY
ncbi:MAG: hypothetical protein WBM02_10915 [bacterium]